MHANAWFILHSLPASPRPALDGMHCDMHFLSLWSFIFQFSRCLLRLVVFFFEECIDNPLDIQRILYPASKRTIFVSQRRNPVHPRLHFPVASKTFATSRNAFSIQLVVDAHTASKRTCVCVDNTNTQLATHRAESRRSSSPFRSRSPSRAVSARGRRAMTQRACSAEQADMPSFPAASLFESTTCSRLGTDRRRLPAVIIGPLRRRPMPASGKPPSSTTALRAPLSAVRARRRMHPGCAPAFWLITERAAERTVTNMFASRFPADVVVQSPARPQSRRGLRRDAGTRRAEGETLLGGEIGRRGTAASGVVRCRA